MIIDWHTHWMSPRALDLLERRGQAPNIVRSPDGQLFLRPAGHVPAAGNGLPIGASWLDVRTRIAHMDDVGVERHVISWPTTLGFDGAMEASDTIPLYRAYNEDLADLVQRHPDRLSAVAALPTADLQWAARELERAHTEYGFIGAVLPADAFVSVEGAKALAPIFEVAQRYRSHIYLHTGPAHPSIPGQARFAIARDLPGPRWLEDAGSHFAAAAVTLTLSDVLDPYPHVSVQIAMLGGTLPYLVEALVHRSLKEGRPDPRAALRRVYYDIGLFGVGPSAIELAVRGFGADRVLFGSDYPLIQSDVILDQVRAANISAADLDRIVNRNNRELLSRFTSTATTAPAESS